MSSDRIVEGDKFKFNNAVWDEIEKELDRDDAGGDPSMTTENPQMASKHILGKLVHENAVIMLRCHPDEWEASMQDLLSASGVSEALDTAIAAPAPKN